MKLDKSPEDCRKICTTIQEYTEVGKYDLILSKMVLEHVNDPDAFHQKVLNLLNDKGVAIHFFACRHSLPALANRVLPEKIGEWLLKILKNRETSQFPKYPAFYKRTKGGLSSQIAYFENMGYEVKQYSSFVGHKYFQSVPILKQIEQLYTRLLVALKMKSLATVALVILNKN